MSPFWRSRKSAAEPPPWAGFFSGNEYARFRAAVEQDLRGRGLEPAFQDDGSVVVHPAGDETTLGLANLAQLCDGSEESDWPALIDEHMSTMIASLFAVDEPNWEEARPLLRLRLWAQVDVESTGMEVVGIPVADDLVAVLVLDFPERIASVHPDLLDGWGVRADEALRLAEQAVALEEYEVEHNQFDEGVEFIAVSADNMFAASQVLALEKAVGGLPTAGAVLAVPNRHWLLVHPICDLRVVDLMSRLAPLAASLHEEGPGSISDQLYWWHDGHELERISVSTDGDQHSISASQRFVDLLNGLAESSD